MKTPLLLHPLTSYKALKQGSSFYNSIWPYLQKEDPIDFMSVDVCGKGLTWFDNLWLDMPEKKQIFIFGS